MEQGPCQVERHGVGDSPVGRLRVVGRWTLRWCNTLQFSTWTWDNRTGPHCRHRTTTSRFDPAEPSDFQSACGLLRQRTRRFSHESNIGRACPVARAGSVSNCLGSIPHRAKLETLGCDNQHTEAEDVEGENEASRHQASSKPQGCPCTRQDFPLIRRAWSLRRAKL